MTSVVRVGMVMLNKVMLQHITRHQGKLSSNTGSGFSGTKRQENAKKLLCTKKHKMSAYIDFFSWLLLCMLFAESFLCLLSSLIFFPTITRYLCHFVCLFQGIWWCHILSFHFTINCCTRYPLASVSDAQSFTFSKIF